MTLFSPCRLMDGEVFFKKKISICSVFRTPWKNHGPSFEQTLLQTSLWLKLPKGSSEGCQYFATYFPFLFHWNDTLQFEITLSKNALSQVFVDIGLEVLNWKIFKRRYSIFKISLSSFLTWLSFSLENSVAFHSNRA